MAMPCSGVGPRYIHYTCVPTSFNSYVQTILLLLIILLSSEVNLISILITAGDLNLYKTTSYKSFE